ncbi:MAG: hypothetical protein FWD78_00175 [Treponema sp.]|nr:hypothetical protein [Treponema sp.]
MNNFFLKTAGMLCLLLLFAASLTFAGGSTQQVPAGKPTLEIGIMQDMNVTDYKNNYMTRYLENLHGIDLIFNLLPSVTAEFNTKLSLMAASNDMPETIWAPWLTREQILQYGSEGIFIPLNKYFSDASKTPYFNQIPQEDRKAILRDTASADGNVYSFARQNPYIPNQLQFRLFVNQVWLAKLGLEVPKTTDDLRNVLIAFRDNDPNGNGLKDEIGVYGRFEAGSDDPISTLINSFVFYHRGNPLSLDASGNNVIAPFTQPAFRQALQYLNDLFNEGLLDPAVFTVDPQTERAVLNANPMVVGMTTFAVMARFPDALNNPNYLAFLPIIAPLSSPVSPGYSPYMDNVPLQISYITNKAKNVDLAVKVMDSFYEPTLTLISLWGEENVDWTRDPARLKGISNPFVYLGLYPEIKFALLQRVLTTPGANKHWMNFNPMYTSAERGSIQELMGDLVSPFNPNNPSDLIPAQLVKDYYPRHPQYLLPQLNYNSADGTTLAQPITDVNSYVRRSIAEFTIGARDINSDAAWNAYIKELDNMGLQQWLRISQETYNRQR